MEAEVVSVGERSGQGQVYEVEYIIDSMRGGIKRVFCSKKLNILNIVDSDSPDSR